MACAHPAKFQDTVKKATNLDLEIPEELGKIFDKKEKMTILANSKKEVKKFILENI